MDTHALIIQLIVAYTLVGALVFTVVMTCLSLVGWIKFADQSQQNKLFLVLIVELVVVSVAFFGGLLNFSPKNIESKIAAVEQYKSLSTGLNKYVFATEILHEFLEHDWTTKTSMTSSVGEYNEAITALRNDEASNLQLLQVHPDTKIASHFEGIMGTVKQIDEVIHGLNDQFEKVAILETQDKVDAERARKTAEGLEPLLATLKKQTADLLPIENSH